MAFKRLVTIRQHAQTAYMKALPNYDIYMRFSGAPPIHPLAISQLHSQIAEAVGDFKRGIDSDWKACLLRYPEILDYFYSLVDIRLPLDDDERVTQPPFAAAGYTDRGYTPGDSSTKNNRREPGYRQRTRLSDISDHSSRMTSSGKPTYEYKTGRSVLDDDSKSSYSSFSSASTLVDRRKNSKRHPDFPRSLDSLSEKTTLDPALEISVSRRRKRGGSQLSVTSTESQQRRRKAKGKALVEDDATVIDATIDTEIHSDGEAQIVAVEQTLIQDQHADGTKCLCGLASDSNALKVPDTRHILSHVTNVQLDKWEQQRDLLPDSYKWDIEYEGQHSASDHGYGCWTCMPLQGNEDTQIPLTIANCPVVLPVEYQWPPIGGVNPPPDPRISTPIDCRMEITTSMARDILLTFPGSLGFYMLVNGLLQIIVSEDFDTAWAASHLPHKFGGLKVCFIEGTMEPTMIPARVTTTDNTPSRHLSSRLSSFRRSPRPDPQLQLNDFVEVRAGSSSREQYSGRIGLKVGKNEDTHLLMSTHVITEAILGKAFFGLGMLSRDSTRRLRDDWNTQIEIIAKNSKVGEFSGKADLPEANAVLIARNNREDLRRNRKHLSQ
jgi:hypothetical protein